VSDSYTAPPHVNMPRLLQTVVDKGASDLHITAGTPPQLRINGDLVPLRTPVLTPEDTQYLADSVLSQEQRDKFHETAELDLSFRFSESTRFRANFFFQKMAVGGVLRIIPSRTLPLADLGFPDSVAELANKPHGLILVTGPTGSGKSTTLASLVDLINRTRHGHIVTIEDPIEFVHEHKKCIINQREVGTDTDSFENGLRHVLRQDPDVVLIGEIRDLITMETALRIAETGHLVFATLHTNNAIQTIHRVIDFFPAHQQDMIRSQLSFVLEAVISQQLVRRSDKNGRVMVCEIMFPNHAIRNLIREDKMHQVVSQMQIGQEGSRMVTLNQSLLRLVQEGLLNQEQALRRAYDQDELSGMFAKDDAAKVAGGSKRRGGR
jgi:twitching motility protein PilT